MESFGESLVKIPILDHGYISKVEHWGSDERIVEAARMSTNKGFLGWGPKEDGSSGDEKLLKYLWDHKHSTPFEVAGMTVEVQTPIFVLREWHRHRTQSYSELSSRYSPLPDTNYIPTVERLMRNSKTNKQAGVVAGAAELTAEAAESFREGLMASYAASQALYETALQSGIPKELARVHLPVGRYSRMRASANLRNWLAFLTLRMDSAAQEEIRLYANEVGSLIAKAFPRTWSVYCGKT